MNAKDRTLRVLDPNPLAGVRGPEAGDDRQGQILYQDELVALLRRCGRSVQACRAALPAPSLCDGHPHEGPFE